ncbi:MAG: ABC transporter permease, partial [Actinomycetota bacterium]
MDSRGSILQGGGAPSAASAGQCRRKRIPSASPGKPPRWLTAASVALAAPFAAPFGYLVVRNLRAEGGLREAAVDPRVIGPLLRTLALAGSVSAAAAVLGVAAAWLAVRSDLPGRRAWAVLLPLPLVIPSFIAALAAIAAFAPGGLLAGLLGPAGVGLLPSPQGFWAAFTLLALITFPYVYLPVAARLRQLPPSLEEAARMLGHPPWAVFFRVVLPQAKIAVLGGGLLVFLYTLSDFGAVQLLRYHTLTWAIYATRLFDPPT